MQQTIKKVVAGTFVVLVLALLYIAFIRKDLTLPKEEVKAKYTLPISKFIRWEGNEIHYTDNGTGTPVLLIHGFGGSTRDFRYIDSLMSGKYRIIRVDLPGFGLSDFPEQEENAPDFNKMYSRFFSFFLDTLQLDTLYVGGNSMGGMAAWALAAEHPQKVKKLVLLAAAGYEMDKVVKIAAHAFRFNWFRIFVDKGLPKFVTKATIRKCFADQSIVTDDKVEILNDLWNREGNMSVFFDLATTKHFLDTSVIKKVSCPTLILWGKEDKIIPVDHVSRYRRDIKNSREVIYSPCGHVPMVERYVEVSNEMDKFFSE